MKKYLPLILVVPAMALAQDEMFLDAGLGAFSTEGHSLSQVKFIKAGVQEDIWDTFEHKMNVGGWLDSRGEGRTSSAFIGYQIGFDVRNDILEVSVWSGPTLISSTDAALGGNFQFNETIFFGVRDKHDNVIGMAYNHFSSAGLEMPNMGKDFMCLEIKFPF